MNTVHDLDEQAASAASSQPPLSGYVVLTAAFNEEQYIEATIQSVVTQTVKPLAWVIVSDGSTDGTDSIIQQYCRQYPFISYLRRERDSAPAPSAKGVVLCPRALALAPALASVDHLPYNYLAMTDAHVTIGPQFFESLLVSME
jgi:cellulose synthase/poly-beta-1,6-N-acetylglucosamine synthase-like glycosyltransferase